MTTSTDPTPDAPPEEMVVPEQRLSTRDLTPAVYRAMIAFDTSITLDPRLRELVKVRASILNGCSFCVDMHATEAREMGEGDRRLATVAAWQHSPFFTARERAALALTDAATCLGDHGVSDAVWAEASAHFPDAELAQLVWAIAAINTWNRVAIATQMTPPA